MRGPAQFQQRLGDLADQGVEDRDPAPGPFQPALPGLRLTHRSDPRLLWNGLKGHAPEAYQRANAGFYKGLH
ncbi:hypothetical protein D3C87_1806710 [compost metagenome]